MIKRVEPIESISAIFDRPAEPPWGDTQSLDGIAEIIAEARRRLALQKAHQCITG